MCCVKWNVEKAVEKPSKRWWIFLHQNTCKYCNSVLYLYINISRGIAAVAYQSHKLVVDGSIPSLATNSLMLYKYNTEFYCRLTCNGKYTIIGTMMKQQFCSMPKPMTLQTSFWLLANGSANSIPGDPGFWLDYIRISNKDPGTKHSRVFHYVA